MPSIHYYIIYARERFKYNDSDNASFSADTAGRTDDCRPLFRSECDDKPSLHPNILGKRTTTLFHTKRRRGDRAVLFIGQHECVRDYTQRD